MFAICKRPCRQCKTPASLLFVLRMYVFRIAYIDKNGDPRILHVQCTQLSLAQFGPFGRRRLGFRIHIIGQLCNVERETIAPSRAPIVNHQRQQRSVLVSPTGIIFPLIPNNSFNRKRYKRVDHGVEERRRFITLNGRCCRSLGGMSENVGHSLLIVGVCGKRFAACPCFDRRSAPATLYKSDGYMAVFLEFSAEEISRRRKFFNAVRTTYLPSAGHCGEVFGGLSGSNFIELQQPDIGMLLRFLLFVFVIHNLSPSFNGHFHVRLPRTKPHFAYQYVFQVYGLSVRNVYVVGAACHGCFYRYLPFALLVGLGNVGFTVPRGSYFNGFSRLCFAPNGHRCLLLQHHVVGEQRL